MIAALGARHALFVSPHLDDAVLSAGGLLAGRSRAGLTSTVLTVFAGLAAPPHSDFARGFHLACGLGDDAVHARRAEDLAALAHLGARTAHGDLPDAVYRRGPDGAFLYDGEGRTFEPRHPDDDIASQVDTLLDGWIGGTAPDLILAPASIGAHVDHLLVRDSALRVGRERGIPVLLWEDQPYALRHERSTAPGWLEIPIPAEAWSRRITATACYTSQLRMLFGPDEDWSGLFTRYARAAGGPYVERYRPADAVHAGPGVHAEAGAVHAEASVDSGRAASW